MGSSLYDAIKSGQKLDEAVNKDYPSMGSDGKKQMPEKTGTARQFTPNEIKVFFLDKVAADSNNSDNLRQIAGDIGKKLCDIYEQRKNKKSNYENVLSLDVNEKASKTELENFMPQNKRLKFPNRAEALSTDIEFYGGGIFDILGYVISCLGPLKADFRLPESVKNAEQTFFLPLVLLYAKWCLAIASQCGLVAQAPSCVEIAVRVTSWSSVYFALGASVAGFRPKSEAEKSIIKQRREALTTRQFLEETDLKCPPSRILTLLQSDNSSIDVTLSDGTVRPERIWKLEHLQRWSDFKATANPIKPTTGDKSSQFSPFTSVPLRQMYDWSVQLAAGTAKDPAVLSFSGDASDIRSFAENWLNPVVWKNWDSGLEFGNCAETYPLLMLKSLDRFREKTRVPGGAFESRGDANITYGGVAVSLSKLKQIEKFEPPRNDGGAPDAKLYFQTGSLYSPCSNCRVLLTSKELAGATSPLMFLTESARPFTVHLCNIIEKQWKI